MTQYQKLFVELYDIFRTNKSYQDTLSYLLPALREHKVKTVLDVGCGTGTVAHLLTQKGFTCSGFDYSQEMVDYASARYPDLHFFQADAARFVAKDYDAIIATDSVLTFLTQNEQFEQAILSMLRQAKKIIAFDVAFTETLIPKTFSDVTISKASGKEYDLTKKAQVQRTGDKLVANISLTGRYKGNTIQVKETHTHRIVCAELIAKLAAQEHYSVQILGNTREPWSNLKVIAVRKDS